jgi:hypothetical protein
LEDITVQKGFFPNNMTMTMASILGFFSCLYLALCAFVVAGCANISEEELVCPAVRLGEPSSLENTAECTCTVAATGTGTVTPAGNNNQDYPSAALASPSIGHGYQPRNGLVSSNDPLCMDDDADDCQARALLGVCAKRPVPTLQKCPYSCAVCNNHQRELRTVRTCYGEDQSAREPETFQVIRNMQDYMIRTVFADDERYGKVRAQVRTHRPSFFWLSRIVIFFTVVAAG